MRATISFEADVSRVNDIMRSLVLEESNALQDALMSLEKATADSIIEGISDALGHIYGVANQLEQYRDMMVSFRRAKFDAMTEGKAPSSPPVNSLRDVQAAVAAMNQFDGFVDKINAADLEEEDDEEG